MEQALEGFELRVVGIVVPLLDEPVDEQEVVAELFDVARVEVRAAILGVLPLGVLFGREGSDLLAYFGHHVGKGEAAAALFVAAVEVEEGVDVKGRAHKDGVVLPHVDHRLRVAPQVGQRGFESRETALETLDEIDLTEARQLQRDALGGHVAPSVALDVAAIHEKLEGAIAEIADAARVLGGALRGKGVLVPLGVEKAGDARADEFGGVGKEFGQPLAQPIVEALGVGHLGESQFGVVIALHVGAGAAHEDVLQHAVADFGREVGESLVALSGRQFVVVQQVVVAAAHIGKEALEIAAVSLGERGGRAVAGEEIDLVAQVLRTVVLRCGGEQADVGAEAVAGGDVADERVEPTIALRVVVAQAVALVDEQQAVVGGGQGEVERCGGEGVGRGGRFVVALFIGRGGVLDGEVEEVDRRLGGGFFGGGGVRVGDPLVGGFVEELADAAGSGEVDECTDGRVGLGVEARHRFAPSAQHRRRSDDEHAPRAAGRLAALCQKVLGQEHGHHRFAQSHHVGEEETAVLAQDVPTLLHGIELIVERVEVFGKVAGEGVTEALVEDVAKLVDERLDVEFGRGDRGGGAVGAVAAGSGAHHLLEKGLRPRFGECPLALKPRKLAVETRAVAGHGGDECGVALEVVEFGVAFESLAREVRTAHDAARIVLAREDVALRVEKLLVPFGIGAAIEVHVDALVGAVGEQEGKGAYVLLGDGQIGEVRAQEIGRVGGVFVLGLLHHRGVDIRVFADEEFDARALALQEAFQFAHQEGHAGQIPIAGGDVEGGEALVA